MSPLLMSVGQWCTRRRGTVLAAWLVLLGLLGAGAVTLGSGFDNAISIPGTESQEALDSLTATFPEVAGTSARLVIVAADGDRVDDPDYVEAIRSHADELAELDGVSGVVTPFDTGLAAAAGAQYLADDGAAAIVQVQLDGAVSTVSAETKAAVEAAGPELEAALADGSEVVVGGEVFSQKMPTLTITEAIGVLVAMIVLFITLGSILAAGMPIVTAILGVGVTVAAMFLTTSVATISSTTPMLALMLGLAVGIDYALFVVARHQEQLRAGLGIRESIGRSVATAGSAVVFAGITVIIALVGLAVANIPFLTVMGIAAAAGVAVAVAISLTLLPALLSFAGPRILSRRDRATLLEHRHAGPPKRSADEPSAGAAIVPSTADTPVPASAHANRPESSPHPQHEARPSFSDRFFGGWVRAATRWPVATILLVVVALGALAAPALSLRLALPDAGSMPESAGARQAYDQIGEHFGDGFNGPLIVTGSIITSTDPVGLMDDLADEIADLPGVASVPLSTPNQAADTGIIQVIPEGAPDSIETKQLVQDLRDLHDHFLEEYDVDLSVTGFTAVGIDVSDRLGAALLPFGLLVVGLSIVLLLVVFRSIVVPIKAALGYLLSVGAAFGAVALVFEFGIGAELLHVERIGPVISFMPIIVMGVLFGLAMDYEVFLVSRIREDYVHTGNARGAIRDGFVATAKVVAAAAVIMFAVFAAFVPEGDANMKAIALALAVGVFVDAFIVRMTLVPAVLQLLGDRAWWLPRWLDRALPRLDIEGEAVTREAALASWPEPDTTAIIAASGVIVGDAEAPIASLENARVERHQALLLDRGHNRVAGAATLLALTGRASAVAGRLKVLGVSVPERAGSIRSSSAYLDLSTVEPGFAARALRRELRRGPRIIALDNVDSLTDHAERAVIRQLLAFGVAGSTARRSGTVDAVLIASSNPESALDLVPDQLRPVTLDPRPDPAGPRRAIASTESEVTA